MKKYTEIPYKSPPSPFCSGFEHNLDLSEGKMEELREQIAKIHCDSCLYRLDCEHDCGKDFETRDMQCRKPFDIADAIHALYVKAGYKTDAQRNQEEMLRVNRQWFDADSIGV